jgi:hypothetical protein
MILPLLIASAMSASAGSVSDFFPLKAGSKWVYERISSDGTQQVEYVAGTSQKVGKLLAVPMLASAARGPEGTTYYAIEGDTVFVVATDAKRPLQNPRPILKLGASGNTRWRWDGVDEGAYLTMEAQSVLKGKRKVLGAEHEILELKITANLGTAQIPWLVKQTAYYARDVGLIEMTEEQLLKRERTRSSLVLKSFVPGSTS